MTAASAAFQALNRHQFSKLSFFKDYFRWEDKLEYRKSIFGDPACSGKGGAGSLSATRSPEQRRAITTGRIPCRLGQVVFPDGRDDFVVSVDITRRDFRDLRGRAAGRGRP